MACGWGSPPIVLRHLARWCREMTNIADMRGLLERLAGVDSSAERGLRVIEFFDELVSHRADAEAVTRATAVLSEATAGAILDEVGEVHVIDSGGRTISSSGPPRSALVHDITVGNEVVGRVWLERDEADVREWDELVMARFALTMANLESRTFRNREQVGLTNAALLHTLLLDNAPETETARAASLLGFKVGQPVRVAAASAWARPVETYLADLRLAVVTAARGRAVAAPIAKSLAVLIFTSGVPGGMLPPGVVACVGPEVPIEQCAHSWSRALRGVRFATHGRRPTRWMDAGDLGCLLAFTDLDSELIMGLPDTQAISRLAHTRDGTDLEILDEVGRRGSLRDVATALHMHHSSVAYRVDRISEILGFDVRTPEGGYRARTAFLLWNLHQATTKQPVADESSVSPNVAARKRTPSAAEDPLSNP